MTGPSTMTDAAPKVSVITLAYRHERFIAQTIESVMMQRTRFPLEQVIGEDGSPDDTRAIALCHERRHPGKIRVLTGEPNMGMTRNFERCLNACRGGYVAMVEGDDYWTSPDKLQRQADYLDAHPECPMVYHGLKLVSQETGEESEYPEPLRPRVEFAHLLHCNPIHTCTAMFRRELVAGRLGDWFYPLKLVDLPLFMLLCDHGWAAGIEGDMAAYRIHPGGLWTAMPPERRYETMIEVLLATEPLLRPARKSEIRRRLSVLYASLSWRREESGQPRAALRAAWNAARCSPLADLSSRLRCLRLLAKNALPGVYSSLQTARGRPSRPGNG